MAQTIESKFLAGMQNGSPIVLGTGTATQPVPIHDGAPDANTQDAVFLYATNRAEVALEIGVYWNVPSSTTSTWYQSELRFVIPRKSTVPLVQGLRMGQSNLDWASEPGAGIAAYVLDSSHDTDISIAGWVDRISQTP